MYRKLWLFLLTGLRAKAELNEMNLWDNFRYWLIKVLPIPRARTRVIEVWQGRIYASSPDEAALKIRQADGCGEGKLVIKEVLPGWYEYRAAYERSRAK